MECCSHGPDTAQRNHFTPLQAGCRVRANAPAGPPAGRPGRPSAPAASHRGAARGPPAPTRRERRERGCDPSPRQPGGPRARRLTTPVRDALRGVCPGPFTWALRATAGNALWRARHPPPAGPIRPPSRPPGVPSGPRAVPLHGRVGVLRPAGLPEPAPRASSSPGRAAAGSWWITCGTGGPGEPAARPVRLIATTTWPGAPANPHLRPRAILTLMGASRMVSSSSRWPHPCSCLLRSEQIPNR